MEIVDLCWCRISGLKMLEHLSICTGSNRVFHTCYMFLKDPVLMDSWKIAKNSPFLAIPSSWRDLVKRSIHSCNSVQQPSQKLTMSPLKKWKSSEGFFVFWIWLIENQKKHLPSAGAVAMGNPLSFPCNTLLQSPKDTTSGNYGRY